MEPSIQNKLLDINRAFYNHFDGSFSATRGHVQPGVDRLLKGFNQDIKVLDVGCGNGTLARALKSQGFEGSYLGVDMSAGLLEKAKKLLGSSSNSNFDFCLFDIADPQWISHLPQNAYDWLAVFAVLHHLPGSDLRRQIARDFRKLISPEGRVTVSVWQWQNSLRLRKRVLPWFTVGLLQQQLDQGDVLLDWRAGKTIGLRYVHTFSEQSLTALANEAGFEVVETFTSDGRTGDLALYQVWQIRA
jgi:2-polyprenyl-3-methyl-5-hydroxy-6-metoxy-1,4-benzoquinol methylase